MRKGVLVRTRGFSIIEILMAMAIGAIVITGVILAAFGDQSTLTSTQLNVAAVSQASSLLEDQQSYSRKDFNLINPTTTIMGDLQRAVTVSLLSDFVTKLITVRAWNPLNPAVDTRYSTLVTNLENVEAPDTCNSTPSGDWSAPNFTSVSLATLLSTTTGAYPITDIDVYRGKLYVSVSATTYRTDPTLLIIDVADSSHPAFLGAIDNASTTSGLAGIRIGENHVNGKLYAYGANAGSFTKGQLQIFDVTTPMTPSHVKTFKISTTYVPSAGNGNSIFFRDGYVYLGLTTAAGIMEFNIIDVRDVTAPVWKGGYSIGNSIEAILVKGKYAYLATDDMSRDLLMFDITDPMNPHIGGAYDAPGSGGGFGRRIAVVGDTVYFGRTWVLNAGTPEFHVLRASNPMTNPTLLGNRDIGTTSPASYGVYGILARDSDAFILTKAGTGGRLLVLDSRNPSALSSESPISSTLLPNATGGAAMDCENNTLYIGSNDASDNGYISIVTPS